MPLILWPWPWHPGFHGPPPLQVLELLGQGQWVFACPNAIGSGHHHPVCGHTVSVLAEQALPYRPLEVQRLEAYFDQKAEVSSGLDHLPSPTEAGCLRRAWSRFVTRRGHLKHEFGQLVPASLKSASHLGLEMAIGLGTLFSPSVCPVLKMGKLLWNAPNVLGGRKF